MPAPEVFSIILPLPNAILRVLLLAEEKTPVVKLNPLKSNVPFVSVVVAERLNVNVLPNIQLPPTPLNVTEVDDIVVPLVVIVLPVVVALNVIAPVAFQNVPATSDILPDTASVPVLLKVTVPADTVISKQSNAPVIVTVYVLAWSKNTESAAVGTLAPLGPPEVADHTVVLVVFQVPVPPTQYLFAIYYSYGVVGSVDSVGIALTIANQLSYLSCLIASMASGVVLSYSS